jgi:signal transduction histidine kinase
VPIGELCVTRHGQQPFGERQSDLLAGLADLAAIAVETGRLLEKERYVAVLEERERLSREMHDSLAQSLAYLRLKAQTTLKILDQQDFGRAGHELREMAAQAHEAYVDVREGILDLRETVSAGTDFAQTLLTYLRKFNHQTGLVVDLDVVDPPIPRLGPGAEVQLLRVIQEALANVRKHANTSRARIRITRGERVLTVAIEDDGQGFDPAAMSDDGRSFGLATMRERVERAGGDFRIESAPGGGTMVEAVFPASEV